MTARCVCAVVLCGLHFVGGYFVLCAVLTTSEGPWDTGVTRMARMWATFGIVTEVLAVAVTAAFVALAGLRKRWYALPVVPVATALFRMVLAPEA